MRAFSRAAGLTPAWIAAAVTSLACLSAPPADADPWEISVSPYVWAASVSGSADAFGRTVDFDAGFGDIFNHLDFTLMGAAEARNGRWALIGDFIYLDVSNDGSTPYGVLFNKTEVDLQSYIGTGAISYRAYDDGTLSLEALAAFRVYSLDVSTKLKSDIVADRDYDENETWVDPVIGGRAFVTIDPHWFLTGEGDVGGFGVGSELAYQLIGTGGYRFDDDWSMQLGYRYLWFKRDFGEGTLTAGFSGPILGFTYRF